MIQVHLFKVYIFYFQVILKRPYNLRFRGNPEPHEGIAQELIFMFFIKRSFKVSLPYYSGLDKNIPQYTPVFIKQDRVILDLYLLFFGNILEFLIFLYKDILLKCKAYCKPEVFVIPGLCYEFIYSAFVYRPHDRLNIRISCKHYPYGVRPLLFYLFQQLGACNHRHPMV